MGGEVMNTMDVHSVLHYVILGPVPRSEAQNAPS